MKLQQLRYLVAVVDNGLNITAAAERLHTSQPGVSKQLKLLEQELGLKLFVRKGRSLAELTDEGAEVVRRAARILLFLLSRLRHGRRKFGGDESVVAEMHDDLFE